MEIWFAIQSRDEAPSGASPLTYRERSYFAPKPLEPSRLELLLRSELETLMRELAGSPRGQFVNLAVFDHSFQGRPLRPPVATLQWKDWRGAPVFAMAGAQPLPSWRPTPSGRPGCQLLRSAGAERPAALARRRTGTGRPGRFRPPRKSAFRRRRPPIRSPRGAQVAPRHARAPAPLTPIVTPRRLRRVRSEPTGDQDRRLAIAFEASQDLYFMATPVEGLEFAVKLLADLVPCEAASGCIYDINTDEFRFVALTGPGATERRAEAVPSTEGLLAAAVRSRSRQLRREQRGERFALRSCRRRSRGIDRRHAGLSAAAEGRKHARHAAAAEPQESHTASATRTWQSPATWPRRSRSSCSPSAAAGDAASSGSRDYLASRSALISFSRASASDALKPACT